MITLYWGLEYAKVLLCYFFILFIWPSIVFHRYLRSKSIIFRFCFCATTQIVLINTVVLGLGLMHLLNQWIVNILFYGVLLFSARRLLFLAVLSLWRDLCKLMAGTMNWRSFWTVRLDRFAAWLRKLSGNLWKQVRSHLLEYILLAVIVVYGVIYFSYSPFVDHSYGFGDMYVHHSWIYGLIQGQIFSKGIYPAGMHCVIYLMHTVSGLPVYSCNLFLGCIHVAVLLLSVYCLMREIFCWRGTPLLVLTVFLAAAVNGVDAVISMARLQRTLPGEYGLHTTFLCALFLLRFLKEELQKGWQKDLRVWLKNDNLLVFSMALAASIAIHFYVTIIAFFICLPFAIVYIRRVFSRTRFLPMVAAVLCGVMISALPMGAARLSGIPFQGSIDWALSVMGINVSENPESEQNEPGFQDAESQALETQEIEQEAGVAAEPPFLLHLSGVWNTMKVKADVLYQRYCSLFGSEFGVWMVRLSVSVAVFWLIYRLICMLFRRLHAASNLFDNYLPIIGASLFIMVLYAAHSLGLPELVSYIRLPSTAYLLLLMVVVMPVDILFSVLQRFSPDWFMQAASVVCVAATCVATLKAGYYHGYFYNELTRYRSVVDVTNSIIQSFPRYTYTIVSSTDDLYQIVQYGMHEELITFLKAVEQGQSYYLPTEYVFLYVEKKPIQHAQYHYSSGPAWLATDIYADNFRMGASKYPEIYAAQITDEEAQRSVLEYPTAYSSYGNLDSRTVINSKVYKWCQDFADLFDHEMKIYYEDEDFVCYYFRQNIYSLYNLAFWD